jgi:tetratricopeptide (TPR) repeat protein
MPLPRFVRNLRILVNICRYNTDVSSIPLFARACFGLSFMACTACVAVAPRADSPQSATFYTVTAEIALSRHEPRVAALQYAAVAETNRDVRLLQHATDVTAQCLQPSLTVAVAAHWIDADPASLDAHRAAARAALDLYRIDRSAAQYRVVLSSSSRGADTEFAALASELAVGDDVYGARQLADKLAEYFPASSAARRLQAYTALRADDPAAAVRSFNAANASAAAGAGTGTGTGTGAGAGAHAEEHDLRVGLWRARILAGDSDEPLAQASALLQRDDSAANRLDYALLLLAAQQDAASRAQLTLLTHVPEAAPVALRLLGLLDFQEGRLDEASVHFAELLATGKLTDDGLYYLGLIAERHADLERALRFYAQVQTGEYVVPALLRAAAILRSHGAAPVAEDLLDRLTEDEPLRAPEIIASRARIYADGGDLPRAVALLEQGLVEYPDSVDLHYAMASLLEEQGRVALALRELKTLLAARPDDPAALNAYGYTLADHDQDLGRARRLIERAYAAAPRNAAILDSYGWVLFRQGHDAQALDYLKSAYADDRGGDIAAHLGEVLWRLGKHADADRIWAQGALGDPDNALLKSTRQRLHGDTPAAGRSPAAPAHESL